MKWKSYLQNKLKETGAEIYQRLVPSTNISNRIEEGQLNDPLDPFDSKFKVYRNWFLTSVAIVCVLPMLFTGCSWFYAFQVDKDGEIGDAIGGTMGPFIAIIAAALTFLAFWIQYKANEQQRIDIKNERFETRFIEFLSLHRANIEELSFTSAIKKIENGRTTYFDYTDLRRKVFKVIYSQYKDLYGELNWLFADSEIIVYDKAYLDLLHQNTTFQKRKINLLDLARVDITYLIVFFGLSDEDSETTRTLLTGRYNPEFIDKVLAFASMKPKLDSKKRSNWNKLISTPNYWKSKGFKKNLKDRILGKEENEPSFAIKWSPEEIDLYNTCDYSDYSKYYGGHQHRLGHYFRHLFQVVEFVDKSKGLNYDEKYSHVKILRAQLSNYEQIIVCINSTSQIGRAWELENKKANNSAFVDNRQYITKYNLIKNIPSNTAIVGIDLKSFYPHVAYEAFESGETNEIRKQLEKQYS